MTDENAGRTQGELESLPAGASDGSALERALAPTDPMPARPTAGAVFVSHSSRDAAAAMQIVVALESAGVPCWVAPRDIPAGADWNHSIMTGINGCRALLLVYSRFSVDSDPVKREVERAINRRVPVVPVRLEQVPPSPALEFMISTFQWVDAYPPPADRHLEKIVSAVKKALDLAHAAPARPDRNAPPKYVGPYRILERLGEGGMGTVYKADQRHPVKRTVAVKLIKPGFDSAEVIARFESERQALARMDHPNVAKVLDAGTDDLGRPFFVMEYVPGEPVTKFADVNKLTVRQRLQLFTQVCDAISHAHAKALIHRDIKASNVLAYAADEKPTVKVIDFGVAKALTGDKLTDRTFNTERGQAIGTYESMSPEQADGSADIDTRTDVYSLGVLLYELLAGSKPFEKDQLAEAADCEIRRIIREVEPPKPSTRLSGLSGEAGTRVAAARRVQLDALSKELRSELEWIPLKAIRKERARRYASAQQLAEDIERYLAGTPLLAGPESRTYHIRKFASRHRFPLGLSAASVAIIGCSITMYVNGIRAEQQKTESALSIARDQTRKADQSAEIARMQRGEAERQRQIAGVQRDDARKQQLRAEGAEAATAKLLVVARRQKDAMQEVTRLVAVQEELARKLPRFEPNNYAFQEAIDQLSDLTRLPIRVHWTALREAGVDPNATIHMPNLANASVASALGKTLLAATPDGTLRWLVAADGGLVITTRGVADKITVTRRIDRYLSNSPDIDKAISQFRTMMGAKFDSGMVCYPGIGVYVTAPFEYHDRVNESGSFHLYGIDAPHPPILTRDGSPLEKGDVTPVWPMRRFPPLAVDEILQIAASAAAEAKKATGSTSRQLAREGLDIRTALLPPDHADVRASTIDVVESMTAVDDTTEALLEQALRTFQSGTQTEPLTVARLLNRLGLAYYTHQNYTAAHQSFLDALSLQRKRGVFDLDSITTLDNLVRVLLQLEKYAEAEPFLREMLAIRRKLIGDEHADVVSTMEYLAIVLVELDKFGEAEALYRQSLDIRRRTLPLGHPNIATSLEFLGGFLDSRARGNEAEPLYREALEIRRKTLPSGHPGIARTLNSLAIVLLQKNRLPEAEACFRELLNVRRTTRPVNALDVASAASGLGRTLLGQGHYAGSEPLLREALATREKELGGQHPATRLTAGALADLLNRTDRLPEAAAVCRNYGLLTSSTRPADTRPGNN